MVKQDKRGRPGIPYETFVEAWEQLIGEGRASTNAAHDMVGGSKSTIAGYRERYEREKASKALSIIKSVELTEAVHRAIAEIKVKEVEALEKQNTELKNRIDEYMALLKEAEEKLAKAQVELDDTNSDFEVERLKLERKLAASEARIEDIKKREEQLVKRYEELSRQHNKAEQEAAVAHKEIEMLREQTKRK